MDGDNLRGYPLIAVDVQYPHKLHLIDFYDLYHSARARKPNSFLNFANLNKSCKEDR